MAMRVRPDSLWLMVPPALWDIALDLNQTQGSALFHLFGATGEHIIVNQLLTDANDWDLRRLTSAVESIRVSFLNGKEEPELVRAELPNAGQLFIPDRIVYKTRLEFGTAIVEHRSAVKATV